MVLTTAARLRSYSALILMTLSVGACFNGGSNVEEAALVVKPGDAIKIETGPDLFGATGKLSEVAVFPSSSNKVPMPGRLKTDGSSFEFKYSRGEEYSYLNVAKAKLSDGAGSDLELSGFMISNPIKLDLSTQRTVEFFSEILRREPESREEIIEVLENFRKAGAGSCLKKTNVSLRPSEAKRAYNNAFLSSEDFQDLRSRYKLTVDQERELVQNNAAPYVIAGFPFPSPSALETLVNLSEETDGSIEVTLRDADGDIFVSQWSTLDGKPVSSLTKIDPSEIRENRIDTPTLLRPLTSLRFRGDYDVSSGDISAEFPVKLSLCDGAESKPYQYKIRINNSNRPPYLVLGPPPTTVHLQVGQITTLSFTFDDADNDDISFLPSSNRPENLFLHSQTTSFGALDKFAGTFELNKSIRDLSRFDDFPETGNPYLEGETFRGIDAKDSGPQKIVFLPGGQRAEVWIKPNPGADAEPQEVPISYKYAKLDNSSLNQHLQIEFGSETEGLEVFSPYALEKTIVKCHAQHDGYRSLFNLKLNCGFGRYPTNFYRDGEWHFEYKCPDGVGESGNPHCAPIEGQLASSISPHAKKILVTIRPTRAQFQKNPTFTYAFNAVDEIGTTASKVLSFEIHDSTEVKPEIPLSLAKISIPFHYTFPGVTEGRFQATNSNYPKLPGDPAPNVPKKYDYFSRRTAYPRYSILNPYEQNLGSNSWEAHGSVKRIRFRGPSQFSRRFWWQHFRWSLENAASPSSFGVFNGSPFIRFLDKAPDQSFGKIVIADPNGSCVDNKDCSLLYDQDTRLAKVPNSKNARVLDYEVLENSENFFAIKIPQGFSASSITPTYCIADFFFDRSASGIRVPSPEYPFDNANPAQLEKDKAHTALPDSNFRLKCADNADNNFADAKSSSDYLQFGPGFDGFLAEDQHQDLIKSGPGGAVPNVYPTYSNNYLIWGVDDGSYLTPGGSATQVSYYYYSSVFSTFYNKLRSVPLRILLPESSYPVPGGDGFYDFNGNQISPSTRRIKLSAAYGNNYRWCRYGLRSQMNTLAMTCSRLEPGPDDSDYPNLYDQTRAVCTGAICAPAGTNDIKYNTTSYPRYVTVHMSYAGGVYGDSRSDTPNYIIGNSPDEIPVDFSSVAPSATLDPSGSNKAAYELVGNSGERERLVGGSGAVLSYKVAFDSDYTKFATHEEVPPAPKVTATRIYRKNASNAWVTSAQFKKLHIWAPNAKTGEVEPVYPETGFHTFSFVAGVGKLSKNEFLVSWQPLQDGEYILEIDFAQEQLKTTPTDAATYVSKTVRVGADIKAWTYNPYIYSWPNIYLFEGQYLFTGQSIGGNYRYQDPVALDTTPPNNFRYITSDTYLQSYWLPETRSSTTSNNMISDVEAYRDNDVSVFFLTKTDTKTGRRRLVNPVTEPDWTDTDLFVPNEVDGVAGALRVPAGAFLRRAANTPALKASCLDLAIPGAGCLEQNTSADHAVNFKIVPSMPLNAIVQESDLSTVIADDFKRPSLFRIKDSGADQAGGVSYSDETFFQIAVAKPSPGNPNLQNQLVLLTGTMAGSLTDPSSFDRFLVDNPTPAGNGASHVADFKIKDASLVTGHLTASGGTDTLCRTYIYYEGAYIAQTATDPGPETRMRFVCLKTGTSFPSNLKSDTPLDEIGQNLTFDFTNLYALETSGNNYPSNAPNQHSFANKGRPDDYGPDPAEIFDEKYPEWGYYYGYGMASIEWGQISGGPSDSKVSLFSHEAVASVTGALVVFDGIDATMAPFEWKAFRNPEKVTTTAGTCPSSFSAYLSLSDEVVLPNEDCTLAKANYSANEWDRASPLFAITFPTPPPSATDNMSRNILNIQSATALTTNAVAPSGISLSSVLDEGLLSPPEFKFDMNTSATGWSEYNKHTPTTTDGKYIPKILRQPSGQYSLKWTLPAFTNGSKDSNAQIKYTTGVDYYRQLFHPSLKKSFNFTYASSAAQKRKINRQNVTHTSNYEFDIDITGSRSLEWKDKVDDLSTWSGNLSFLFLEQNLPPCISSPLAPSTCLSSGGATNPGATIPAGDHDGVLDSSGGPEGIRDFIGGQNATNSTNLLVAKFDLTQAAIEGKNPLELSRIYEGGRYYFNMNVFDPNLSTTSLQILSNWKEITSPTVSSGVTPLNPQSPNFQTAQVKYFGKDSHIDRADPYKKLNMQFSVSDSVTGTGSSDDAIFEFNLEVWDINNAPIVASAPLPNYSGSTFAPKNFSFSFTDVDAGDGYKVYFDGATTNKAYVTCDTSGINDIVDLQAEQLLPGDLIYSNDNVGAKCTTSLSKVDNSITVPLVYWDTPELRNTETFGVNFSVQDIVWWKISTTDDWDDAGTPKQYEDRHHKKEYVQNAPLQAITLIANLNAPPELMNQTGALTVASAGQFIKDIRMYENQMFVEPLTFYNPKRLPVTCYFEDPTDFPQLIYKSGANFFQADDLPEIVNIDPNINYPGNNILRPSDAYTAHETGAKALLPNVAGCVVRWKPNFRWYKTLVAGESRSNSFTVTAKVGSDVFKIKYRVGHSSDIQYFLKSTDLGYAPDSAPRYDSKLFDLRNELANTSPVISEGDSLHFYLTYNGNDPAGLDDFKYGLNPDYEPSITWWINGEPVLSDQTDIILTTDFLKSGFNSVSVSVRTGSILELQDGKPGNHFVKQNIFVKNTRLFPLPIENNLNTGLGFARLDTQTNNTSGTIYSPLHIKSFIPSNSSEPIVMLTATTSKKGKAGTTNAWTLRYGNSEAPSLITPFKTSLGAAALSSRSINASGNKPYSSFLNFTSIPIYGLGDQDCYIDPDPETPGWTAASWGTACTPNLYWNFTLSPGLTNPWQPSASQFGYSQTTQAIFGKSYSYKSEKKISFSWGSEMAVLNFASSPGQGVLNLGSYDSPTYSIPGVHSIVGGITNTGLEDSSWLLAVLDSGGTKTLNMIVADGTPRPVPGVSGYEWVWIAQCGASDCSNANVRRILLMSIDGALRWGDLTINIGTGMASFSENAASAASTCTTLGLGDSDCIRFSLIPPLSPQSNVDQWHSAHLFPAKYTNSNPGSNMFHFTETGSPSIWSLDLASGQTSKLSLPKAVMSGAFHCNNPQTTPSSVTGVPVNERCYVGDAGNEGVHELR